MKWLTSLIIFGFLVGCTEHRRKFLTIVVPDNFKGFGAIYQPNQRLMGGVAQPKISGDKVVVYAHKNGAIPMNDFKSVLVNSGFRITVVSQSGRSIPLTLATGDKTDGTRFWLLAMPDSREIYFYLGTMQEVDAFLLKEQENIYSDHFSLDAYFQAKQEEVKGGMLDLP